MKKSFGGPCAVYKCSGTIVFTRTPTAARSNKGWPIPLENRPKDDN